MLAIFGFFGLVTLLYVFAVFLTFAVRSSPSFGEWIAFGLTLAGGLISFVLGYASLITLGGKASLGLVEFTSRFNKSSQVIEVRREVDVADHKLVSDASLFYVPALIFVMALALALNIHYLHTTTDITFQSLLPPIIQGILSVLDIFIQPTSVGSLRYSIEIIPIMIFIVAIAGVVPSIVFPYLRKFKITSINAPPFHKDILLGTAGTLFGLTVILSLVDLIYGALTGNQPHYYSYVLPAMLGFSLHYFLGAYVGREKAEAKIMDKLKSGVTERVFQGRVYVQKQASSEEQAG